MSAARVGRLTRIKRYWRALPMELWHKYPEQVAVGGTFGLFGLGMFFYKINKFGVEGIRAYYRGRYDIVRPDEQIALDWRPPEDYPPSYLTNRENVNSGTYKRDYGWKSRF